MVFACRATRKSSWSPRPSRGAWLAFAAAVAVAGGLALQVMPYRLDDAFITFRFADHVASGDGLVWNRGGPPVEGFSSPLWLIGLSAVSFVFGSAALPDAASVAGFASLVACLLLALRAGPRPVLAQVCMLALFASSVAFVYYAVTGLEAVAFACLALLYVAAVLERVPLALGIAAGLAATWMRPEGPWLLACHAAALLAARAPWRTRRNVLLASALVLGAAALLALRLALFASLVPNTYHAKPPVAGAGARYVWSVLSAPWAAGVFVLGALGACFGAREQRGFMAAALVWLGAPWLEGGDWMPVGRFALPALGFALLAGAGALGGKPSRARTGAVLAAVALTAAVNVAALRELAALARSDLESIVHEQRVLAQWLQRSGAKSVALVDIGEVGYRTSLEVIDLAGLTDPRIARMPGAHLHKTGAAGYVLDDRQPDLVVLRVNGAQPRDDERVLRELPRFALEPIERALAASPTLRSRYRLLFAMLPADLRTPFYGRVLYGKRDLALRPGAVPERRILYLRPLQL